MSWLDLTRFFSSINASSAQLSRIPPKSHYFYWYLTIRDGSFSFRFRLICKWARYSATRFNAIVINMMKCTYNAFENLFWIPVSISGLSDILEVVHLVYRNCEIITVWFWWAAHFRVNLSLTARTRFHTNWKLWEPTAEVITFPTSSGTTYRIMESNTSPAHCSICTWTRCRGWTYESYHNRTRSFYAPFI